MGDLAFQNKTGLSFDPELHAKIGILPIIMTQPFLKARVKRATVPKIYRFIAPFHDGLALVVESKARQYQIDAAQIVDGEKILEVAVGTGLSFQSILERNPHGVSIGVDITPAMLKRCRKRVEHLLNSESKLIIGDAFNLPFEDSSFDLLINGYMFDLLSSADISLVLHEFARVLKPGGRMVLNYMTPGETAVEKMWDGFYRIHPFILGGCRGVTATPYLNDAGFVDVETKRISYRTFPSEIVSTTVQK